jgi:predicted ATPase/DNA-binding winged helix-turn-helix (wHTH) protein
LQAWRIELFGGLWVKGNGQEIARFRTRQAGALLAYLAYWEERAHSRETLIGTIWPEDDTDTARAKLRQALASLRKQLELPGWAHGSVIIADRLNVRLNREAVTTDVAEFRAALAASEEDPQKAVSYLANAVSLYNGPLLEGYYDEWIAPESDLLTEQFERARDLLARSGRVPTQGAPSTTKVPAPAAPPAQPRALLPFQATRYFGQEDELVRVAGLLAASLQSPSESLRIATIMGPGGCGKTRFSIEAARRVHETGLCNICFVPLADVRHASGILDAMAASLGLERSSSPVMERITEALAGRPILLVLDNFEQLADTGTGVVRMLMVRLPDARFLITSRQSLGLPGERRFPLRPLPVPSVKDKQLAVKPVLSAAELVGFPSVQLFVDRAQAIRPDFQITPSNAQAVAGICEHLEGLPLALELAASWIGALTPAQMLARFAERSPLQGRGKRGTPRHRTIQAAIDWSYQLLPAGLRRFFTNLSVFSGGWTLEAAAAICLPDDLPLDSQEAECLEMLARLRERSLILAESESDGSTMRYRFLESLREFATEQRESEQASGIQNRHAFYFLQFAEEARPNLRGTEQAVWLNLLDLERNNCFTALDWMERSPDGTELELRMVAALHGFWWARGYVAEGEERVDKALARSSSEGDPYPRPLCAVMHGAAFVARLRGDFEASRSWQEKCLELARADENWDIVAAALGNLGNAAKNTGDYPQAIKWYEEALDIAERTGNKSVTATTIGNLGNVTWHLGDLEATQSYYERSLALSREIGDTQGVTVALSNLGALNMERGEYGQATAYTGECLRLCEELGDPLGIAFALEVFGHIALKQEDWPRAATLFAAALDLRVRIGTPLPPHEGQEIEQALTRLRTEMGKRAFQECWDAAVADGLDAAIEFACKKGG